MRHEPFRPCHLSQDINAEECPSPELQKCAIQQAVAVPYWLSHLQIPGHFLLPLPIPSPPITPVMPATAAHAYLCNRQFYGESTQSLPDLLKAPFVIRAHPGGPPVT